MSLIPQITPSLITLRKNRCRDILKIQSLKHLVLGGEKWSPKELFGDYKGETIVWNMWGLTEVSCWGSYYQLKSSDFDKTTVPLGKSFPETDLKVDKDGRLLIKSGARKNRIYEQGRSKLKNLCILMHFHHCINLCVLVTECWSIFTNF